MSADPVVTDSGVVVAREASRRLERTRRAALNQALVEKRRLYVAQVTSSLAEVLGDHERSGGSTAVARG